MSKRIKYPNIVSTVSPVYNSHIVLCEQLHYLSRILKGLDKYVEVIFVDDGSDPPLDEVFNNRKVVHFDNFKLLNTGVKIPWNQLGASNLGAKNAKGNYILFFDIDHIITKEVIIELLNFKEDMIHWKRINGALENGKLITTEKILKERYGAKIIKRTPFGVANTFGIKKDIFNNLGGYNDIKWRGYYNFGDEDLRINFRKARYKSAKSINLLYVYPDPSKTVHLFHKLTRLKDSKEIKNIKIPDQDVS